LQPKRRRERGLTRSPRRSEFCLSRRGQAMSSLISHQSSPSGALVTSVRPSSPHLQLRSAINVDTYYVPNALASRPSCRNGPSGMLEMRKRTAIPKQKNRSRSSDARGESHDRGFGGSAKTVMVLSSTAHHPVQDVATCVVINVLDHRKYQVPICINTNTHSAQDQEDKG
jgi:hypothetical protein